MKFSPRKAVLAGVTALALSTTALTAAPAIAEENQQKNSIPSSSEIFGNSDSSKDDGKENSKGDGKESKESTVTSKPADSEKKEKPAEDKKEGSSLENKGSSEGGFDFKKFSEILKAISGVVGVASTIFAFLKSLKII